MSTGRPRQLDRPVITMTPLWVGLSQSGRLLPGSAQPQWKVRHGSLGLASWMVQWWPELNGHGRPSSMSCSNTRVLTQPSQHREQSPQGLGSGLDIFTGSTAGNAAALPQHRLYFLPLPQGHGALRPEFDGVIAAKNFFNECLAARLVGYGAKKRASPTLHRMGNRLTKHHSTDTSV